ncbi:hypothetical protein ABWK22_02405 [Gottfriedia acidiceleris]|uniref:hypothetical protein n=1 Tax=Gottfriedia acidiceleris TaxID=371036 RepID=UPI00339734DF
MIYNLKTEKWVECYYRKVDTNEVGEYVPPRWVFNFIEEHEEGYEIFVIETEEYPGIAQGIVALKANKDEYTVHLKSVETADFNKYYLRGKKNNGINYDRVYKGIGFNLVSFACQYSLDQGCDGYMYLKSKTDTIPFYTSENLGGKQLSEGSQTIVFDEPAGQRLASKIFPGGAIQWLK